MNKILLFFLAMIFSFGTVDGQSVLDKRAKIDAINSVMHFINEGSHGMLIVHRMLENYNQDINKYADLESFKINFYTNKDLPKDIFDDQENWFYDTSPYEWYEIAIQKAKSHKYANSSQIIAKMTKMKNILTEVNQIRFDLDDKIIDKDLTDPMALKKVYDDLKRGEELYANYFKTQLEILDIINRSYKNLTPTAADIKFPVLYRAMSDVYRTTREVLLAIRYKDDENIYKLILKQGKAVKAFEAIDLSLFGSTLLSSRKLKRVKKNVEEQSLLALDSAKKFYETADVPEEYQQYGKFYYYYNSELINKFNRYGNGIVFELNNIIDYMDFPVLIFTELPHYYKYILPKKLETVDYIVATDPKIVNLPSNLKERELMMSTRKIRVDSLKFEIALYDPKVDDGDIISLNFNGDWIIKDMRLATEHKKLKMMLNEEGKNYFILHAENVGRQPPNTMAMEYYFEGKKEQIILQSDLNVSEMIEIEYVK